MKYSKENIVGEVVADDYRTASVFKAHKIDFCCKGNRSIGDVCVTNEIDVDQLIDELSNSTSFEEQDSINFRSWDLDLLADYIEKKHHRYVEKRIPELKSYLSKVSRVHGVRHPELLEIEELFTASAHELISHMAKEEQILFPYIRKIEARGLPERPPFGTAANPIAMMKQEHETEGERFRRIAEISDQYSPPADACTTYRVAFSMLKEFEEDLHRHIHLENNILFPGTIAKEEHRSPVQSN